MKKILSIMLAATLMFALAACGSSVESSQSVNNKKSADNTKLTDGASSLVVYFSCTGNTESVAEKITELTGADIYEIVPSEPYTDEDINYNDDNCRANKEMNDASARPEISSDAVDLSQYDTVYIGYPIWWGTKPRIIDTFLDEYDLSGKNVMPFCTSGGSGIAQSVSEIKECEPDADVRDGLRASGSSDDSISSWISDNS